MLTALKTTDCDEMRKDITTIFSALSANPVIIKVIVENLLYLKILSHPISLHHYLIYCVKVSSELQKNRSEEKESLLKQSIELLNYLISNLSDKATKIIPLVLSYLRYILHFLFACM